MEGKRKEADALKGEMSTCKQQVVDLENLLQVTRTKEWQNLMALEEKQSEAQLLKDRLTLNDNKMSGDDIVAIMMMVIVMEMMVMVMMMMERDGDGKECCHRFLMIYSRSTNISCPRIINDE